MAHVFWPRIRPLLVFTVSPIGVFSTLYTYTGHLMAYFSFFIISYQVQILLLFISALDVHTLVHVYVHLQYVRYVFYAGILPKQQSCTMGNQLYR